MHNEKMPQSSSEVDVFGALEDEVQYRGEEKERVTDRIEQYVSDKRENVVLSDEKPEKKDNELDFFVEKKDGELNRDSIEKIREIVIKDVDDPYSLNEKIEQISKEMRKR